MKTNPQEQCFRNAPVYVIETLRVITQSGHSLVASCNQGMLNSSANLSRRISKVPSGDPTMQLFRSPTSNLIFERGVSNATPDSVNHRGHRQGPALFRIKRSFFLRDHADKDGFHHLRPPPLPFTVIKDGGQRMRSPPAEELAHLRLPPVRSRRSAILGPGPLLDPIERQFGLI